MPDALSRLQRIREALQAHGGLAPEDEDALDVALAAMERGEPFAQAFGLPRNWRQRQRIEARNAALRRAADELAADAEALRSRLLRRSASANRPPDTLADVLDAEDGKVRSIPTIRRALAIKLKPCV